MRAIEFRKSERRHLVVRIRGYTQPRRYTLERKGLCFAGHSLDIRLWICIGVSGYPCQRRGMIAAVHFVQEKGGDLVVA